MWDDVDEPVQHGVPMIDVIVPDLPVRALTAAKAHMEDLLREVQLVLLDDARTDTPSDRIPLIQFARRLDASAEEFAAGRRQVRAQALAAAARGDELVTLRLRLPTTAI